MNKNSAFSLSIQKEIQSCRLNVESEVKLGKRQSKTFESVVAWASIIMLHHLILAYILSKRQITGPIGPLFRELAREHLQLVLAQSLWKRIRQILMLSSIRLSVFFCR